MEKGIDFTSLMVSPIEKFSEHINEHLDQVIKDYVSGVLEVGKCDQSVVENLTKEIADLKLNIKVHRKALKIRRRKFVNGLIIFFSILLVGLFFLPIYFKNKPIINQFETETAQKQAHINDLINQRFQLITNALSTATFRDAYNAVFKAFGMFSFDYLPFHKLYSIISSKYNDVVFLSGLGGLIKNSPFYDVVFYQHEYRIIRTSNSMSFKYIAKIGDKRVTRYETLTAFHEERTPFVEPHNALIYLTNFVPELTFQTNSRKYDKNLLLENKKFVTEYRLVDECENKAKLSEFFTLKTQENFVDWYSHENGRVPTFSKDEGYLFVWGDPNADPKLELINFPLSWFMFRDPEAKLEPSQGLKQIDNTINQYFSRLVKMLQLPLLVPGISREWYKSDGQYLIATSGSSDRDYYATYPVDDNDLISKFNTSIFIDFIGEHKCKRRPWMTLQESKPINRCRVNKVFWNSYWSQILIDNVIVFGKHVGEKIIPVEYEEFNELQEEKIIITAPALLDGDDLIISSQLMKDFVNDQVYDDEELKKFVLENSLWTNHPERLNQAITESIFDLVDKINLFRDTNHLLKSSVHLILDQARTYLVFNNPLNLTEETLQIVLGGIEQSLDKPKTKPFMRND